MVAWPKMFAHILMALAYWLFVARVNDALLEANHCCATSAKRGSSGLMLCFDSGKKSSHRNEPVSIARLTFMASRCAYLMFAGVGAKDWPLRVRRSRYVLPLSANLTLMLTSRISTPDPVLPISRAHVNQQKPFHQGLFGILPLRAIFLCQSCNVWLSRCTQLPLRPAVLTHILPVQVEIVHFYPFRSSRNASPLSAAYATQSIALSSW